MIYFVVVAATYIYLTPQPEYTLKYVYWVFVFKLNDAKWVYSSNVLNKWQLHFAHVMYSVSWAVTLLWTAGIQFVQFSARRMLTMLKVSGVNTLLTYNGYKGNMTHLPTLPADGLELTLAEYSESFKTNCFTVSK